MTYAERLRRRMNNAALELAILAWEPRPFAPHIQRILDRIRREDAEPLA
jgi:hypothetical protein